MENAQWFGASESNCHQKIGFQLHNRLPLVDLLEEEIFGRIQYLSYIRQQCANEVKAL